jgi:hypothetical protein
MSTFGNGARAGEGADFRLWPYRSDRPACCADRKIEVVAEGLFIEGKKRDV